MSRSSRTLRIALTVALALGAAAATAPASVAAPAAVPLTRSGSTCVDTPLRLAFPSTGGAGATTEEIEGVDVVRRPALAATAPDVLAADGYLLGTPANLGYMSGALKHFFDQISYPCPDTTRGRPFGYYVHGGSDVTGAVRGIESVTTGLGWEQAAAAVTVTGEPDRAGLQACWELGASLAAQPMP